MPDIFNDYDESGYRTTSAGCRSSRVEDAAIVRNLRATYGAKLKDASDQRILNTYDMFAVSEDFGDDNVWLEHWLHMEV